MAVNDSRGIATCQLRKIGLVSIGVGDGIIFPGIGLAAIWKCRVITTYKIYFTIILAITGSHKGAQVGQGRSCAPRVRGDVIDLVQIVNRLGVGSEPPNT